MGKSGTPGLREALRAVKASGRAAYKENRADYLVAESAAKAGLANLSAQQGVFAGGNRKVNANAVGALQNLRGQARASARTVRAKESAAVNRYGAGLGGSVASQFGVAKAAGAAGVQEAKAALVQGRGVAGAGATARDIAAQGVQAQGEAAQYALAQALQARNQVSSDTMAQLTGQLYQTALQYNMQWDLWKKQQNYALNLANKQKSDAAATMAARLPDEMGTIGASVATTAEAEGVDFNGGKATPGDDFSVSTALAAWAGANGYAPTDPEFAIAAQVFRNIKSGMMPGDATQSAIQTLYAGAPGGQEVLSAVAAASGGAAGAVYASLQAQGFYTGPGAYGDTSTTAPNAADVAGGNGVGTYGISAGRAWNT